MVSEADDVSITSLYNPNTPPLPIYAYSSFHILRLRAMSVLERSSKLMYLKPEPSFERLLREQSQSVSPPGIIDEYLSYQNWAASLGWGEGTSSSLSSSSAPSPSASQRKGSLDGKGWMRTAKVRTPHAYEEVRAALLRIEEEMPPERRTNWEVWDGHVQDWHFSNLRKEFISLVSIDLLIRGIAL